MDPKSINNGKIYPELIKRNPYQRIAEYAFCRGNIYAPDAYRRLLIYGSKSLSVRTVGTLQNKNEGALRGIAAVKLLYAGNILSTPWLKKDVFYAE